MTGRRPVVLVTGSAGLIGTVLTSRLNERFTLRGFDRVEGDRSGLLGEVRDTEALTAACSGADSVVHLAADQRVDAPWQSVLDDNIVGTYSVFEAARRASVKQVIFASSNHVVGMAEPDWRADPGDHVAVVGPDAEIRPDSLYGVSKAFGEALGRFYSERHGLRVICLRLGSVLHEDDPWLAAERLSAGPVEPRVPSDVLYRRFKATWLSHRDCADLFDAALRSDVRWAVVYGVSANPHRIWDLDSAARLLGFHPRDAAPENADPRRSSAPRGVAGRAR